MAYKAFISFKNLDAKGRPTRDSAIAAQLYSELKSRGIEVFFSNEEVQRRARPDYADLIDEALDSSRILLLVGTCVDYIESKWVKYEWNSFRNEINSGRKDGYIIPVIENITVGELPFALRHGQVYTSAEIAKAADMVAGVLGSGESDSAPAPSSASASSSLYPPGTTPETERMNDIGDEYYYGRGGRKQDYAEAVKWYSKAAALGCGYGYCNLGICCEWGNGVEQDGKKAAKWYRKAAEKGIAVAQLFLANLYEEGKGVDRDIAEAVKWYRKAADQGDEDAVKALSRLLEYL